MPVNINNNIVPAGTPAIKAAVLITTAKPQEAAETPRLILLTRGAPPRNIFCSSGDIRTTALGETLVANADHHLN